MSKMNKFQAFRERNRKSNGYLLRKVSFNVAYKIVRFVLLFGLCFLILQPLDRDGTQAGAALDDDLCRDTARRIGTVFGAIPTFVPPAAAYDR